MITRPGIALLLAICIGVAGGCGSSGETKRSARVRAVHVTRKLLSSETHKSTVLSGSEKRLPGPVLSRPHKCGNGVTAGTNTTCPFAESVVGAYAKNGHGELVVDSPVTHLTYRIYCTGGSVHICAGENNVSLYFGDASRYVIRRCGDDRFVGPHTPCPVAASAESQYVLSLVSVIQAFDPEPHDDVQMYCTLSSPHTCAGGRDVRDYTVYFP